MLEDDPTDDREQCGEVAHHWFWSINTKTDKLFKMWICAYHHDLMEADGVNGLDADPDYYEA